ncbi:MAG: hypothetical protein SF182_22930 [Deltaproteobacteria bacterium]|nr:hypothetical protein [Deltaproteobacteria bacterium]
MDTRRETARRLLSQFAARTAATAARPARRYLWTDAFAACTWLGLARATGDAGDSERALRLVEEVHEVLGRHRGDDGRAGWISGLDDARGRTHPTAGGLRIGKPLAERRAAEPFDERLEWERDGQYFHYLTKWMHALDQVARATGQALFNRWARELALAAHRGFTWTPRPGAAPRMYWKMSIDLSRPRGASLGQHDPLDGLVTCLQLQATTATAAPRLDAAIADFAAMVDPRHLATGDPLGIGGLLFDAFRLVQIGASAGPHAELVAPLLDASLAGLQDYARAGELARAPGQRLAFRELGLAIGLACLDRDEWQDTAPALRDARRQVSAYAPLRTAITSFWCQPQHQLAASWREHADINEVMLAASLAPEGFLVLPPPRAA